MRSRIGSVGKVAILIGLVSACGIGQEVLLSKFSVEAGDTQNAETVVIDTTPESHDFTVSWKTNASPSYSIEISVTDVTSDDGEHHQLLYLECDDRSHALCRAEVVLDCVVTNDLHINCDEENYHIDMSELATDETSEIRFKLEICNLFNNNCENQKERLRIAPAEEQAP